MDTAQGVPHAHTNNQWVGYDDTEIVQLKVISCKHGSTSGDNHNNNSCFSDLKPISHSKYM